MHGLVNRSIEEFLRANYGEGAWLDVAAKTGVDPRGVHMMRDYPDDLTGRILDCAAHPLGRDGLDLAEDLGAWMAAQPALRRLLRFGGTSFAEFMLSLTELPGRARMVVPGLVLPPIHVSPLGEGWCLTSESGHAIWLYALTGVIRAMADDYGVLALIEPSADAIAISVPLADYTAGRPFSISNPRLGVA